MAQWEYDVVSTGIDADEIADACASAGYSGSRTSSLGR